jgi:hypothetical protein
MDQGDICICGDTREVHVGGRCWRVGCNCKQFVVLDLGPELFEALEAVLPFLPDRYDARDYAATNDGRAGQIHVVSIRARELIHRAKNS